MDCYGWYHVVTHIFRAFLLWRKVWYMAGSHPGGARCPPLQVNVSAHSLLSDWLTACFTLVKKLYYIIFWTPAYFSSGSIHVIHFPVPLSTSRHRCNILFLKSTTYHPVKDQYVTKRLQENQKAINQMKNKKISIDEIPIKIWKHGGITQIRRAVGRKESMFKI